MATAYPTDDIYFKEMKDNGVELPMMGYTPLHRFVNLFVGEHIEDDAIVEMATMVKMYEHLDKFFNSLSEENKQVLEDNCDVEYELNDLDYDSNIEEFIHTNIPISSDDDDYDSYYTIELIMGLYYFYCDFKNYMEKHGTDENTKFIVGSYSL